MKSLTEILQDIAPYVIVTGSYAEGTQTMWSDIDFYVLDKPDSERDRQAEEEGIEWSDTDETYIEDLIQYFEDSGYAWDSCFPYSFDIDATYPRLEFSAFYKPDLNNIFEIEIKGVILRAAKSLYKSNKPKLI